MGFIKAGIDPLKGFYFNTLTVGTLSSIISSTKEISFSMNILISINNYNDYQTLFSYIMNGKTISF